MSLQELEEALPALLNVRTDGRRFIDWEVIRREVGAIFPLDFVALAEAYPSFTVDDFLGLHIPSPGEERYFIRGMQELLHNLAGLRDAGMSHGYVPFPEPNGLIPWGDSAEGDIFYWRTVGADPELWTVLVSSHNDDWNEYNGSLTRYLAGKMRGDIPSEVDGLPPNFPNPLPVIEADA